MATVKNRGRLFWASALGCEPRRGNSEPGLSQARRRAVRELVFAVSAFYNLVPPYHMSNWSAYP